MKASRKQPPGVADGAVARVQEQGTTVEVTDSDALDPIASLELDLGLDDLDVALNAVKPCDFVPSTRQQAKGQVPEPYDIGVDDYREEKGLGVRGNFVAGIKALDPRGIGEGEGISIRPLIVLGLLGTAGAFDVGIVSVLLILYIGPDLNLNSTTVLSILGLVNFLNLFGAPLIGHLADRLPRLRLAKIGQFLTHGGLLACAVVPTPGWFIAARLLSAIGPSISAPATAALIPDYYPRERLVRSFAFIQLCAIAYAPINILVIVYVVNSVSWRFIVGVSAIVGLLCSLLLFTLREPGRGSLDRAALGASQEVIDRDPPPVPWGEAWRILYGIRTLRWIWYAAPVLSVGSLALAPVLIRVLLSRPSTGGFGTDFMSSPNFLFYNLAAQQVLGLLLVIFSVPLGDRLLKVAPARIFVFMGATLVAQGGAFLMMALSPYLVASLFLWIVGLSMSIVIIPAQYTMLAVVIPPRVRGLGMQSTALFAAVGGLGVAVVGGVMDVSGPIAAMTVLAILYFIGGAITAGAGKNVVSDIRAAKASALADDESVAAARRGKNKMIICRDVDVSYDGAQVLFNVDLDVEEGEIVALLGTNGAGKSTMLRVISGIQTATNGAVYLDGKDVTHKPAHLNARDGIVFMPGGRAVFPTLTVDANLRAAAWLYREDETYLAERRAQVLEMFPVLVSRLNEKAGDMSGGEQQQLALAQALLMRPRLLMIDELSLGLAPAIVERLLDALREVNKQGTTVVLVEQSINVALTIASRAVFMDRGKVRFDGSTAELMSRTDLVRSVFLGGAGATRLPSSTAGLTVVGYSERERMLAVEGLTVRYGGYTALNDVTFDAYAGEVIGIIGPNGAGKTTLFEVISGFTQSDAGTVSLQATDVTKAPPPARSRLGLVRSFQNPRLFPALTVRENIAVALHQQIKSNNPLLAALWVPGIRKAERRIARRVDNLIELFHLGVHAEKFVSELSTGTRRFVDLACATAAEPRVLLLDEPSSGLAQAEIEALAPTVRRLAADINCTVVVIEHDMPLVTQMSDRLIAMDLGVIIATGDPGTVLDDAKVKAAYLSASDAVTNRSGQVSEVMRQAAVALGMSVEPSDPARQAEPSR